MTDLPEASHGAGAAIVRHTCVRKGCEQEYGEWRSRITTALSGHPGFQRVEVYPPDEVQSDWVTIERYDSVADARAWLTSDTRAALADEVVGLVDGPDSVAIIVDEGVPQRETTAVITDLVARGHEREFRDWVTRIQNAQSRYPGYLGVSVQEPIPGVNPAWVTLLRFDTAANLRGWLESDECEQFRQESQGFLEHGDYRVTRTSFRNWLPAVERAAEPSVWKVNAIVLLVLYPVVMLTIIFLNPRIAGLGVGPVTFIGNVIGVAATGFWLVPWAAGRLQTWLVPPPDRARRISLVGWLLMVLGYVVLVSVMSALAVRFI